MLECRGTSLRIFNRTTGGARVRGAHLRRVHAGAARAPEGTAVFAARSAVTRRSGRRACHRSLQEALAARADLDIITVAVYIDRQAQNVRPYPPPDTNPAPDSAFH